jgi:hypothetical protein
VLDVDWSRRMACEKKPATTVLWELEPLEDLAAVKAYWQTEGEYLLALVRGWSEADFERVVKPSWQETSFKIKHIVTLSSIMARITAANSVGISPASAIPPAISTLWITSPLRGGSGVSIHTICK